MRDVDGATIGQTFRAVAQEYRDNPLLVVPSNPHRDYHPLGASITFADAWRQVQTITGTLQGAGYGHGHRIAFLLANRPEILLLKLACNQLGVSWVPINPDYRPAEIGYLLEDSGAQTLVCLRARAEQAEAGIADSGRPVALAFLDELHDAMPAASAPVPLARDIGPDTEASLLYTSGTTGKPKGCILSHEYELMMGAWYASRGGRLHMERGAERVYSPLPLFHVNSGILLFFGMLLSGNCHIVAERFSRRAWWREIRETRATGMHYLGVIIPVLMNEPASERDRDHHLKWGLGAGVDPVLHAAFEDRFGAPLIEVWGMTEMCRILTDCHEPREIHTRAMGRPQPGVEVRVVDGNDDDVPVGEPGELLVRHSAQTPRKRAFSGYLNQPEATEHAWRGGWLHTGDTVSQGDDGMLYFVDRKKNVIRRSGENIAAAEVEACLQGHENVAQVAVLSVEDERRDEEVLACVIARDANADAALARRLFDHCFARLAYFKAPGWIVFVEQLPVTGTQKVLKHMIFDHGQDPRELPSAHDMRGLKKSTGRT